ncbi:MAG: ABC transporter substrate-binding protein [Anaeroplasmataceae bacterium]
MRKRNLLMSGLALASIAALASCGSSDKGELKEKDSYKVGILQLMTHDALGAATKGFKDYINENLPAGKTVEFVVKNPEGDSTNMQTMANQLIRECDIVLGNATPAITQLVASAQIEGMTKKPLLFTSVTDPVAAEIVDSWESHLNQYITGTSDINPVNAQIELMYEVKPSTKKIGFLYNIGEINSKTQCDAAIAYLASNHSTCATVTKTVSEVSQIGAQAQALVDAGCDFVYLPTDNMMASNIPAVTNVTNAAGVPVVTGESGMVNSGGTFTFSIKYEELGRLTGKQACQILFEGKKVNEIPVEGLTDSTKMEFAYNKDAVDLMGIELSAEFKQKYNITE